MAFLLLDALQLAVDIPLRFFQILSFFVFILESGPRDVLDRIAPVKVELVALDEVDDLDAVVVVVRMIDSTAGWLLVLSVWSPGLQAFEVVLVHLVELVGRKQEIRYTIQNAVGID